MYYAVGTSINLKTGKITLPGEPEKREEDDRHLLPVGTRISFRIINGIQRQFIQIPVAYA